MTAGFLRFFRRRMGREDRTWPMLALLLAVLLAASGCVLWFMREAVRNTRLAVRQSLVEAYRGQLILMQKRVEEHWIHELEKFDRGEPGPGLFARAAGEQWADAVISFDSTGRAAYPEAEALRRSAETNAALLELEKVDR